MKFRKNDICGQGRNQVSEPMDKNFDISVIEKRINTLEPSAQLFTDTNRSETDTQYSRLRHDLKKMAAFYVMEAIEHKIINVDLEALNSEARQSDGRTENLSKLIVSALQQGSKNY